MISTWKDVELLKIDIFFGLAAVLPDLDYRTAGLSDSDYHAGRDNHLAIASSTCFFASHLLPMTFHLFRSFRIRRRASE